MKQRTPVFLNILIVVAIIFIAYNMFIEDRSFLSSPYFWGTVIISIITVLIQNSIGDLLENKRFGALSEEEKKAYLAEKRIPFYKRAWESAFKKQSSGEEKDILIDHGFDGIMELDNQLPRWWLGLFYFGVVFLVVYVLAFSFTDFANPIKEYEAESKKQLASIQKWMEETPPPTIDNAEYSADNVSEGEQIFKTNCVTCHGDGGKGGIGPNLTDNYWINQKESTLFKNIFYMVENGSENNPTMQAWGKNGILTGFDIEKVAAYVYYINQEKAPITTEQGGAAPQGTVANWEK